MTVLKPIAAVVAAAALALLPALPAAAIELSPEVTIAEGSFPHISAAPGTGSSLIVYQDLEEDTIWGVVVDAVLTPVVGPFTLSTDADQVDFSQPFAEWNPDAGTWLVAWDNDESVFGRVVSPTTGAVGSTTVLASHAENDPADIFDDIEQTEVAWGGPANGYLVGFKAFTDSECQQIYGVLADADGQPKEAWASELSSALPDAESCDVQTDDGLGLDFGTDSWLIAFKDTDAGQATARLVGVSGNSPAATTTRVALGEISNGAPSVLWDAVGSRFLVTWSGGNDIRANFVSATGTGDATAVFAVDAGEDNPRRPRVAYDATTSSFVFVAHTVDSVVDAWELPSGSTDRVSPTVLSAPGVAAIRPVIAIADDCATVVWVNGEDGYGTIVARTNCEAPAGSAALPHTGVDAGGPLAIAAALLLAGLAAFGVSRRAKARV